MNCPICTTIEMEEKVRDYHFTECGLNDVWLKEWMYFRCPECAVEIPLLPDPDMFTQWLVRVLVKQTSRLRGDEIFFLRKAMGLTGVKLAEHVGATRVEVSRWENDRAAISFQADFQLRMNAIELLPEEQRAEVRMEIMEVLRQYHRDVRITRVNVTSHVHRELVAV